MPNASKRKRRFSATFQSNVGPNTMGRPSTRLNVPLVAMVSAERDSAVPQLFWAPRLGKRRRRLGASARSEEHTSELQSLAYLVCRLLLEKKKKNNTNKRHHHR